MKQGLKSTPHPSPLPCRGGEGAKRNAHVTHVDALPPGVLLYTKPQMAAAMQVSIRCLTGMMRRGEISYLKIHGRMVRFRLEDVQRQLTERCLVREGEGARVKAEGGRMTADKTIDTSPSIPLPDRGGEGGPAATPTLSINHQPSTIN